MLKLNFFSQMNNVNGLPISQLDPISQGIFTGAANVFAPYLGPLPQLARIDPYENRNSDIYTLPENYKGQNKYLGETITDLTITAHQSYFLQYIMPPVVTDQLTQTWTKLVNNAHMMDITPYLARSHKVTKQKKFLKTTLYRIGIEAEFEVEFMGTPAGRVDWLSTLRQFVNATKETMHQAGFRALVNCHRNQNNYIQNTNHLAMSEFKKYLEQDREWFACVQKKKHALGKLDTVISKEMDQRQGEADAYLVPKELAMHVLWKPEMTDHYLAGDFGPNRVNATGVRGTAAGNTQGTMERVEPLYVVKQYPAYLVESRIPQGATEEEVMNLARVRQIGEYFLMEERCDYTQQYRSKHRSILIFDEEENDMVEVKLKSGVKHCGIWDGNGKLMGPNISRKDMNNNQNLQDLAEDFLIVKNQYDMGNKKGDASGYSALTKIGDMDPKFLPSWFLICAGKSLMGKVAATDKVKLNGGLEILKPNLANLNAWFDTVNINEIFKDDAVGLAGITETSAPEDIPLVASKVDQGFLDAVKAGVPATKRSEVQTIFDDANVSITDRTDQIRSKILQYVESNVSGVKHKSTDAVNTWYDGLKSEYVRLKSTEKTPEKISQKVVGYVPVGTDLSGTGYEFVGTLHKETQRTTLTYDATTKTYSGIMKQHMKNINATAASVEEKLYAGLYLLIKFEKAVFEAMVEKDVRIPMNFLILRPHMQYLTRAVIKLKQNGGTGVMLTGHDNFMMSWESGRKSGQMHYTTHIRPFVPNPENCYVKPDVYVQGSEGGAGSRFWDATTYQKRDYRKPLEHSLICVAIPVTETKFPMPLDTRGHYNTSYVRGLEGEDKRAHYSTCYRYMKLHNFGSKGTGGTADLPAMIQGARHDNTICYPGHHQRYDVTNNNFGDVKIGKGHWGKDVYPGCADVRHGSLDVFETQNYAKSITN